MCLKTIKFEFQLWSVIVEISLNSECAITTILLIATSSGDRSGESLEILLVQRLSTLTETFENDKARFAAIDVSRVSQDSRCNIEH